MYCGTGSEVDPFAGIVVHAMPESWIMRLVITGQRTSCRVYPGPRKTARVAGSVRVHQTLHVYGARSGALPRYEVRVRGVTKIEVRGPAVVIRHESLR